MPHCKFPRSCYLAPPSKPILHLKPPLTTPLATSTKIRRARDPRVHDSQISRVYPTAVQTFAHVRVKDSGGSSGSSSSSSILLHTSRLISQNPFDLELRQALGILPGQESRLPRMPLRAGTKVPRATFPTRRRRRRHLRLALKRRSVGCGMLMGLDWDWSAKSAGELWLCEGSVVVVATPAGLSSLAGMGPVAMSFASACETGLVVRSSERACVGIVVVSWWIDEQVSGRSL